jgi:hypothetical protein
MRGKALGRRRRKQTDGTSSTQNESKWTQINRAESESANAIESEAIVVYFLRRYASVARRSSGTAIGVAFSNLNETMKHQLEKAITGNCKDKNDTYDANRSETMPYLRFAMLQQLLLLLYTCECECVDACVTRSFIIYIFNTVYIL